MKFLFSLCVLIGMTAATICIASATGMFLLPTVAEELLTAEIISGAVCALCVFGCVGVLLWMPE